MSILFLKVIRNLFKEVEKMQKRIGSDIKTSRFTHKSKSPAYIDIGVISMPTMQAYNRRKAVQYAKKWAYGRNPAYYDFSELGGDCTNFISQCLYAGSGVMNDTPEVGWYYKSLTARSPSWTGVEFLYRFLVTNNTRGPFAQETEEGEMEIGDVIQLGNGERFYHSLLVTGTENGLYVAAHSFNAYMRPLVSYSYDRIRFLHIAGVYI